MSVSPSSSLFSLRVDPESSVTTLTHRPYVGKHGAAGVSIGDSLDAYRFGSRNVHLGSRR